MRNYETTTDSYRREQEEWDSRRVLRLRDRRARGLARALLVVVALLGLGAGVSIALW